MVMTSFRLGSVLSSLLAPLLILLLVSLFCFSSSYVSALPQVADEPRQLALEVRNLEFGFANQGQTRFTPDLEVQDLSGRALFSSRRSFYLPPIGGVQQDAESALGYLIEEMKSREAGRTFAYSLPDRLPTYVTDEPRPTLEDNMGLLERIVNGEASDADMLQPWYKTFDLVGSLRWTVYYSDGFSNLYTGVIDIPAGAFVPEYEPIRKDVLRPEYRHVSFPLNFTQAIIQD